MRLSYGAAPITPLQILEILLTFVCVAVAFVRPEVCRTWFASVEQTLVVISRRRWLSMLMVGLLPLILRLLLLPAYGVPAPFIHDEYAYLLQADTFASGRLTNPTPPFWQHFSSIYILIKPSYTAEYQVGQAVVLALGQVLFGSPWAGVLISMAVFCALLYWSLLAWLPPVWALVGTLVIEVEIGVLSYWVNGYWGGCVPGVGGALVLGALPRLRQGRRFRNAAMAAIGMLILMNSRPVEGLLLLFITIGALLYWTFLTKELSFPELSRQILPPITLALVGTLVFFGFYNYRVTGNATEFPYLLYRSQYGIPQGFFWQKAVIMLTPMPADIRAEYETQFGQHERRNSSRSLLLATGAKARSFWEFYVGVPLTVSLLFLPFVWREPNMGLAFAALVAVVGFENLTFFAFFPHYAAAVAVIIVVTISHCIRKMRASGPPGLFLSRALPLICVFGLVLPISGRMIQPYLAPQVSSVVSLWRSEFARWPSRERFVAQLEHERGQQLVMVRYRISSHLDDNGWVYNSAGMDHAKIVWAREIDPESDRRLLEYFSGRKVWLAEPDESPQRLTPYSEAHFPTGGP